MVDGDDSAAGSPGRADGGDSDERGAPAGSGRATASEASRGDGGHRGRGGGAKPLFTEEQHRWIGSRFAREEDRRRAIETERDGERERVRGLTERISTLERDYRQAQAENAVIAAAARARADNPAHIYRMVRDELQYDEDGRPLDVDALIEQFRKENPRYFGGMTVSGADGRRGGVLGNTATDMDAVLRDAWQNSKIRVKR